MNVSEFRAKKRKGEPISVVTAYDFPSGRIAAESSVDAILVGDSVAMVVHGFSSTIHATVEMMESHTAAVRRGAPESFLIVDMPFLTFRKGVTRGLESAERLMRAGASAVKVEGWSGVQEVIAAFVESGIPVMGHVGLEPQSVNQLGGYRVQGKEPADQERILEEAQGLEQAGAFSMVLECIPKELGKRVTEAVGIPTIGIGAGPATDGQVLVWHDLLGFTQGKVPKFVRSYRTAHEEFVEALNAFHGDVMNRNFPNNSESY